MIKKLILSGISMFICACAFAQFPYTLTVSKQLYTPLTSGTEFMPGHIWTDTDVFITPAPFAYKADTLSCHTFFSEGATSFENDTNAAISSGLIFYEDLFEDRGLVAGTASLSPVRYTVSGVTGSRIFKVEVANAGFNIEYSGFGTMKDSVNVQLWIYEGSNIIELRYGPSKISHPNAYFNGNTGPTMIYAKDLDRNATGSAFVINSDPTNPRIDTLRLINGNPDRGIQSLDYWPTDSTVYRFTPKPSTVNKIDKISAKIYPTLCSDHITIELPDNHATAYNVVSVTGAETNIHGTITERRMNIDVSTLPQGVYIIQMQNDTGTGMYKFTKI